MTYLRCAFWRGRKRVTVFMLEEGAGKKDGQAVVTRSLYLPPVGSF